MCGLLLVALPVFLVKDPKKLVSAHPLMIVAQISFLQSIIYFYMANMDIGVVCWAVKHVTYVIPLIEKIPFAKAMLDKKFVKINDETKTFRLIWGIVEEMLTFMGLIQLILAFFFLVDMIMTWRHPIKYISS
jgi:hypothetical protein